jgi:hypothetical protein
MTTKACALYENKEWKKLIGTSSDITEPMFRLARASNSCKKRQGRNRTPEP